MVRLLSGFGYKEKSSGGSHRRFENPTSGDIIMGLVKPHHPRKEVRRAYLRKVIQHLGLTSDPWPLKSESFSYKGYAGSSEFSHEDRCLIGQILYIDDLILYEGDNYDDLEKAFHSSVDEYLEFWQEVGKEPQESL